MNKPTVWGAVLLALIAVGGAGYWIGNQRSETTPMASMPEARQPLFYRNPMNPEVTSPVPAKDNMGMDYIAVYADADAGDSPAGTVRIDPVTTQSIGVRTATVEQRLLSRDVRTVGRVDYDEQRITRLHPKTEGWVEELFIETTGQSIKADEILLSIYSPQLVSTQQEYLLALNNLETLRESPFDDVRRGAATLVATSLERLELFDVPAHQIEELKTTRKTKKRMHIHSPSPGVVINVGAREGQYVTPQTELYFIADLSRVWVFVDIFEEELPWVRVGDEAEMQVAGVPGTTFKGQLSYIYPYAERKTRTIKARLEFANDELLLKPDMFADVVIRANPKADVVVVPSEAVVRSGLREKIFVVREPGKFEPRDVVIGVSSEGWTEIREGVVPGEEIVVSAQFLIDSESKLREAAAKMQEIDDDQ
ncbi:MAG: efflux RND transporter periplasmic adaptor subunit [Gammaproteobacteria bacterium]|nr:efflux RND transporter periplasmic adaptor subunit [Gammaproteobacteria bacterium]